MFCGAFDVVVALVPIVGEGSPDVVVFCPVNVILDSYVVYASLGKVDDEVGLVLVPVRKVKSDVAEYVTT